jgi:threonine dehydrogenase-like Zn-dependent dehydrogenase
MSQSTPDNAAAAPGGARERLGVAGSGTVACGLATCAALAGLTTVLWARSAEALERARRRIDSERERAEKQIVGIQTRGLLAFEPSISASCTLGSMAATTLPVN